MRHLALQVSLLKQLCILLVKYIKSERFMKERQLQTLWNKRKKEELQSCLLQLHVFVSFH